MRFSYANRKNHGSPCGRDENQYFVQALGGEYRRNYQYHVPGGYYPYDYSAAFDTDVSNGSRQTFNWDGMGYTIIWANEQTTA